MPTLTHEAVTEAGATAHQAAVRAGLEVHELTTLSEMSAGAALVNAVWGDDYLPVHLQRAVAHAGSYVAGALRAGRVVGIILGILGLKDGAVVMHSHVAGVLPGSQGRSVGYAMKLHQRAWGLQRGVSLVSWTFDPLVRRNAYFNLAKLAADGVAYEPNFYGAMGDGINAADESDRLVVQWRLGAPGVIDAAAGRPRTIDVVALRRDGAVPALVVGADEGPEEGRAAGDAQLLCQIPHDILVLRADPARRGASKRWRAAVRDVVGGAVGDGYRVAGMSRDGFYLLSPPGSGPDA